MLMEYENQKNYVCALFDKHNSDNCFFKPNEIRQERKSEINNYIVSYDQNYPDIFLCNNKTGSATNITKNTDAYIHLEFMMKAKSYNNKVMKLIQSFAY